MEGCTGRGRIAWILLAALPVAALAGAPATGRAALTYDLSLGAGLEWNDNVFFAPDPPPPGEPGPLENTVTTVSPGASLLWEERDDSLRLEYQGAYQSYSGQGEIPAEWIHRLDADLEWRRWEPFFLEVRERRERVPQYQGGPEVDDLNRADRNLLTARAGFSRNLGRTARIELAARGDFQSFPQEDAAERVSGLHAELRAEKRWSPLWSSTLTADYGDVSRSIGRDYTQVLAGLEIVGQLTPAVTATGSLAWRQDRYGEPAEDSPDEAAGNQDYLFKGLIITKAGEHGGALRLGYGDRVEDLVDGDTLKAGRGIAEWLVRSRLGSSLLVGAAYEDREFLGSDRTEVEWGPGVDARWVITEWLALDVRGSYSRISGEGGLAGDWDENLVTAGAGLIVLLGKHVQLETGYRYVSDDTTLEGGDAKGSRVYVLVTTFLRPFARGRFPLSVSERFAPFITGVGGRTPGR